MTLSHNEKNEKLIKLLKASKQNFTFNEQSVKTELMQSLARTEQNETPAFNLSALIFRFGAIALGLVLVTSAGLVFASTGSNPGESLFAINKLSERFVLSLPLSDQKKAEYRTRIAEERLNSLNLIGPILKPAEAELQNKILETVQESDLSLGAAVDAITTRKQSLEESGDTAAAEKLSVPLTKLETLAGEYEEKMEKLEDESHDAALKESISEHLDNVKKSHSKVLFQLHRQTGKNK